jgi:co-chaperonin GroES (HSP10)
MELEQFQPAFRNVLFREVRDEKTKSGIYIPSADFKVTTYADMFENDKEHKADGKIGDYVVIKVGKDCTEVKVGDIIFLEDGARVGSVTLDGVSYPKVMEQQISGYIRK